MTLEITVGLIAVAIGIPVANWFQKRNKEKYGTSKPSEVREARRQAKEANDGEGS